MHTCVSTYVHTSPGSPERLALRLEHVDHDAVVDVVACVRVDLGHVRTYIHTYIETNKQTYIHTYIHASPGSPDHLSTSAQA